jgi:hypothetical protein
MRYGGRIAASVVVLLVAAGCVAQPYGETANANENAQTKAATVADPPSDRDAGANGDNKSGIPTNPNGSSSSGGPPLLKDGGGADAAGGLCPNPTTPGGYQWNPPGTHMSVCTSADMGFFEGEVSSSVTFPVLEAGMRGRNVPCADCIFSRIEDVTWSVVVDEDGGSFPNYGACYTNAPGGSLACGNAFQNWTMCLEDACQFCATDADFATCQTQAAADPNSCARYDYTTPCGAALTSLSTACGTWSGIIQVLCGQ